MGSFLRPLLLLLNSGVSGLGPQFPMASQPFPSLTGAPGGIVPLVFPTFPVNPQASSMGSGGAFPLLATGSVRPVISLPCLEPRSSVATPPPPPSVVSSQLPVGAVTDTSFTMEVEEEMDASCSLLQSTFSEAAASQDGLTADPSTPLDLQSYDHILSVVLNDLGKSELLVRDLPKPRSFWELDQETQVKSGAGALNIDPDMVAELTKAFQEPSTMLKLQQTPVRPTRSQRNCTRRCLSLLKRKRKWLTRWEISGPGPLTLISAEPWKRSMSRQWRPGSLDGI